MADPDYIIVLHSKYSPCCQKFMEIFSKNPVPYIKPICVDNKTVRQKLFQSNNIRISTVPAVILVYPNKKLEKFEGGKIYEWLLDQITANMPKETVVTPNPEKEPISETPVAIELTPIVSEPVEASPQFIEERKKTVQEVAAEMVKSRGEVESGFKRNVPITPPIQENTSISNLPVVQDFRKKTVSELAAELMKDRNV